jgi:hypothetical protein
MKLFSVKRIFLAAAIFTPGMMGSVEWSNRDAPSVRFINGDFTVTTSTASAGEAYRVVRRAPCTLVRYYVAAYSAPVAEAWARSIGATDAEIKAARSCIAPRQSAQVG